MALPYTLDLAGSGSGTLVDGFGTFGTGSWSNDALPAERWSGDATTRIALSVRGGGTIGTPATGDMRIDIAGTTVGDFADELETATLKIQSTDGTTVWWEGVLRDTDATEPYVWTVPDADALAILTSGATTVRLRFESAEEPSAEPVALPVALALGEPEEAPLPKAEPEALGIALALAQPETIRSAVPLPLPIAATLGEPLSPTTAYATALPIGLALPRPSEAVDAVEADVLPIGLALPRPSRGPSALDVLPFTMTVTRLSGDIYWSGSQLLPVGALVGDDNAGARFVVAAYEEEISLEIQAGHEFEPVILHSGYIVVESGGEQLYSGVLGQDVTQPHSLPYTAAERDAIRAVESFTVTFREVGPALRPRPLPAALELGRPISAFALPLPLGVSLGLDARAPTTAHARPVAAALGLDARSPVDVLPLDLGAALALDARAPTTAHATALTPELELGNPVVSLIVPPPLEIGLTLDRPYWSGITAEAAGLAASLALDARAPTTAHATPLDSDIAIDVRTDVRAVLEDISVETALSDPLGVVFVLPNPFQPSLDFERPYIKDTAYLEPLNAGLGLGVEIIARMYPLAMPIGLDLDVRVPTTAHATEFPGLVFVRRPLGYSLSVLLHPRELRTGLHLAEFDASYLNNPARPLPIGIWLTAEAANAVLLRPMPIGAKLFLAEPDLQYRDLRPLPIAAGLHLRAGRAYEGIAWPDSLPQDFLAAGFNMELADHVRRHGGTDGGRRSRRYTEGVDLIRGRMYMTPSQYDTFFAFYDQTLRRGARSFYMPAALEDGTLSLVEFDDLPGRNRVGGSWEVSLSLRVIG